MCRRRLEEISLDKYSDSASFFSDIEKLINEIKSASAQMSEGEKLYYMLNTLLEGYFYIADIINALKEENLTVGYVKNKIEIAERKDKSNRREVKTNASAAKRRRMLQMWKNRTFCERVALGPQHAATSYVLANCSGT